MINNVLKLVKYIHTKIYFKISNFTKITLFIKIKHLKIILHIFIPQVYNHLQEHYEK